MTFVVRHARVLLAAYSVLLVLAVFSPSSQQQSGAVVWLDRSFAAHFVKLGIDALHFLDAPACEHCGSHHS